MSPHLSYDSAHTTRHDICVRLPPLSHQLHVESASPDVYFAVDCTFDLKPRLSSGSVFRAACFSSAAPFWPRLALVRSTCTSTGRHHGGSIEHEAVSRQPSTQWYAMNFSHAGRFLAQSACPPPYSHPAFHLVTGCDMDLVVSLLPDWQPRSMFSLVVPECLH